MILQLCGKKELDMFLAALVVKDMDKKIWNHVNNYGENSCMLSVYVEGVFFFLVRFCFLLCCFPFILFEFLFHKYHAFWNLYVGFHNINDSMIQLEILLEFIYFDSAGTFFCCVGLGYYNLLAVGLDFCVGLPC